MHLLLDDERSNDEDDGNAKLEDDQQASDGASGTQRGVAFQYIHRLEGRKIKGGIDTGDKSDQHRSQKEQGNEPPGFPGKCQRTGKKGIKGGQGSPRQSK